VAHGLLELIPVGGREMGGLVELDRAQGILAEHAVDDTDVEVDGEISGSWRTALSIPSCGTLSPFDHERGEFSPTDWRRLQFFEDLVGSRACESPLVPLLHLVVRGHSTTDDGLLIRCQVHDRNLTVLPAAADQAIG